MTDRQAEALRAFERIANGEPKNDAERKEALEAVFVTHADTIRSALSVQPQGDIIGAIAALVAINNARHSDNAASRFVPDRTDSAITAAEKTFRLDYFGPKGNDDREAPAAVNTDEPGDCCGNIPFGKDCPGGCAINTPPIYAPPYKPDLSAPAYTEIQSVEGLEEALAMPYCEAAQYYEFYGGTLNQALYDKARNTFQAVWEAARLYAALTKRGG